tara:strand:+ start:45 stop:164 length:120 start_codon:yes stop_codon:yes gene_type:complete
MWVSKEQNKMPEIGGKDSKPKAKSKKTKHETNGKLESEE